MKVNYRKTRYTRIKKSSVDKFIKGANDRTGAFDIFVGDDESDVMTALFKKMNNNIYMTSKPGHPRKKIKKKVDNITFAIKENKITKSELREIIREEIQKLNEENTSVYIKIPSNKWMNFIDKHKKKLNRITGSTSDFPFYRTVLGSGDKKEGWVDNEATAKKVVQYLKKNGLGKHIKGIGDRNGYAAGRGYTDRELMDKYY